MADTVLEKDSSIQFPHFTILKASAGSGKTYSLTKRFVQFLLSGKIPRNNLRNILAITFSNNAAKEMKERILSWLKDLYFKDSEKIKELSQMVSLKEEHLAEKAGAKVDEILRNYSDFQVKTIDSFIASIYKASEVDLGDSPDFDIVMAPENIMAYAFNRFLRGVKEESPEAEFLERLLGVILESRGGESAYLWDPSKDFLDEIVELHNRVSGIVKEAKVIDAEKQIESAKKEIRDEVERLNRSIEKSGLTRSKGSSFYKILEIVRNGNFPDLVDKGLSNPPVIKPKREGEGGYEKISEAWDPNRNALTINYNKLDLKNRDSWCKAIGSLQLPFYLLAYSTLTGEKPEEVDCMFLLLGRTRIDSDIEVPLFKDETEFKENFGNLTEVILSLLREIVNPEQAFLPTADPKNHCDRCAYGYLCTN